MKKRTDVAGLGDPTQISDLGDAPYNPRRAKNKALAGLSESAKQFGDISGLVFNFRTGHMIAGHQRKKVLAKLNPADIEWGDWYDTELGPERYGDLRMPSGNVWRVRGVDWALLKEKAANIAANNPHIAGEFTDELQELLAEVKLEDPGGFENMNFDELFGGDDTAEGDTDPQLGATIFKIVVECSDENHQAELLAELEGRGFKCTMMMV